MPETSVYDLPYPTLASLADGPDGFQDLADKMEATLLGRCKPFTSSVPKQTWSSGAKNYTLSSVPLGCPVFLTLDALVRFPSWPVGGIYLVMQIFDGAVKVAGDLAAMLTDASGGVVWPYTIACARVFVNAPVVRYTIGGTGAVTVDAAYVSGLSFDRPS